MKFIRIRKYLASNNLNPAAFLIDLDDNGTTRSYVSYDRVFREFPSSALERILPKLMATEDLDNYDSIVDASSLFYGATMITEIDITLPNAVFCTCAFYNCTSLVKLRFIARSLKHTTDIIHVGTALKRISITAPKNLLTQITSIVARCKSATKIKLRFV